MAYYRRHFPDTTVLPKMHFLEVHVPQWLEEWKVGLGFMGEQGAESIHSSFNTIEQSFLSMPNRVDRLFRIVQEHHLRIDPELQSQAPAVKRRKKGTSS